MLSRRSAVARITLQFTALLLGLYLCMALLLYAASRQVAAQVILSPLISLFPAGVMLYAAGSLAASVTRSTEMRAARAAGSHPAARPRRIARALGVVGLALLAAALGDLLTLLGSAGRWAAPGLAAPGISASGIAAQLSLAEACVMVSGPFFILGALWLPARKLGRSETLKMTLDLAIVLIATALVGWGELVAPFGRAGVPGGWWGALRISAAAWNDCLLGMAVFWLLYHEFGGVYRRATLLLAGGAVLLILYHGLYRYLLAFSGLSGAVGLVEVIHSASSLLFALSGAAVLVWLRMGEQPTADSEPRPQLMGTSWWHYHLISSCWRPTCCWCSAASSAWRFPCSRLPWPLAAS